MTKTKNGQQNIYKKVSRKFSKKFTSISNNSQVNLDRYRDRAMNLNLIRVLQFLRQVKLIKKVVWLCQSNI